VAEVRAERGITQEGLAERLDWDPAEVSRVERGKRNLTLRTLLSIARALRIEPPELWTPPKAMDVGRPGRPKGKKRARVKRG
jgi:transcriptional regulator with XRE-family HTH domain